MMIRMTQSIVESAAQRMNDAEGGRGRENIIAAASA